MNVFFVSSELHLLIALEAVAHFQLAKSDCHLIIAHYENRYDTYPAHRFLNLVKTVKTDDWAGVFLVSGDHHQIVSKLYRLYTLWGICQKIGRVERVFTSWHTSYLVKILKACCRAKSTIYMDDGTSSLQTYKMLSSERPSLRDKLFGPFTFFTFYDFEPLRRYPVIRHHFARLKESASDRVPGDHVWFIGTPARFFLDDRTYCACVEKAVHALDGRSVTYIPHPLEERQTTSAIAALPSVEVMVLDTSTEKALVSSPSPPKVMAGFFSTALETTKIIASGTTNVIAFRLPPHHLSAKTKVAAIDAIYDRYTKLQGPDFTVIDLK